MPIKIYLPNSKYGALLPQEDSSLFSDRFFAVADGVTRDPKLPKEFKGKSVEDVLKYYPRPSGAYTVARIFSKHFVELSAQKKSIKTIFSTINRLIAEYNNKKIRQVNYLENDYFGCVACGGSITNDSLSYACIGDCGIAIFDFKGKIKFQTENGMKKFIAYENKFLKKKDFNWLMSSYRKLVRSEYRNTLKFHNNALISFGVLTGEKKALRFVEYGKKKLSKGDVVLFYSDGFAPFIDSGFLSKLIQMHPKKELRQAIISKSLELSRKDYEKFGHERSLIIKLF